MTDPLFLVVLLAVVFVGFNVGGATTAPAFGPAIGAGLVPKVVAGGLMSAFFLAGAWTLGRRVVDTLASGIVHDPGVFTLETSAVVLGFVGLALFAGNRFGIPASTTMTTVGAIVGLAMATGELDWAVVREIVTWWVVAPIAGFVTAAAAARYLYPRIESWIEVHRSEGRLVELDRSGSVPRPVTTPATHSELIGGVLVVGIGCVMAFSSGTSNIANAIAPLVGSGDLGMDLGILLGSAAVAAGALTIARRTLDTLGNEITALSLPAAIVVAPLSAGAIILLSALGIPASFVVVATTCIAGIGWGRETRGGPDASRRDGNQRTHPTDTSPRSDEAPREPTFDAGTTARVVLAQHAVPATAMLGSYLTFRFVPLFGGLP